MLYEVITDFGTQTITAGQLSTMGTLDFPLDKLSKAVQCKLEVDVVGFSNSWDFWVFPAKQPTLEKDDIYYTDKLDQAALKKLEAGASVLLDASGKIENGKDIV